MPKSTPENGMIRTGNEDSMDPLLIRFALKAKGITICDVARGYISKRTHGPVSEKTVRMVIDGKSRSQGIEERIATLLELPPQKVFPNWYSAKGARKRKQFTRMVDYASRLEALERCEREVA